MTRQHPPWPTGPRRSLRRRDQKGAALVEFSLVVGFFVFVLYGLIAFGMILATKQRVTNAAAEGARAAVGSVDFPAAKLKAETRITQILGASGDYQPVVVTCPAPATTDCIQVTISWTKQVVSKGLGMPELYPISSEAKVQFKG